ncbi:Platelet endothelial aggregation receptor 1 [Portunus trituberculatus]|uniref:Platelet endothelial aggregation receptor 1 n=1 Tax=Portunus trituberculatus TaxID=210409 RepID=A0A5B7DS06_PORTR|nr:Platelet endothelial aggregation receptor 1 [Portunus trituberculatus]
MEGKYGPGCKQVCECYHGGSCHPATGHCSCTPGWLGPTCREEDADTRAQKQSVIGPVLPGAG